ncbi:hypothetical protein [Pontibaca methylaminivorans]|uniref:hypothetical protein n=1 Tax=Pontibaca methylaminivorans TaxID=515897 RepID=UPI000975FDF8|nr:hypothetical protein [Pontibaca methylaminivorans]
MRQIGANPVAVLQSDSRNYAPLAEDFSAAFMREMGVFSVKSGTGLMGERDGFYEGKITEDGTISGRFWKLLLSAHWLGDRFRHHGFEGRRAAILRKALALLGFERHHRPILACFRWFWPKPHISANVDTEMMESKTPPLRAATDGENVSGKFAVVVKSHEFTLVP